MEIICISKNELKAVITNYGARLMQLWVPDLNDQLADIVLGFETPKEYIMAHEKYYGATIGRFANRIADGIFKFQNQKYQLNKNNGKNHLHGGVLGFHHQIWEIVSVLPDQVIMKYNSKHLEEHYPSHLNIQVTYTLTDENSLKISYNGQAEKPTILNMTHHSFFNLSGQNTSILEHQLQINAFDYIPINEELIPLGYYESVENSPFDFRIMKPIGADIEQEHEQLKRANGYDHTFVLDKNDQGKRIRACTLYDPISKRQMDVFTNQPGLQVYTANFLDGSDIGKNNMAYHSRSAICLETQHFPDTPNQALFPSCEVNPQEGYNRFCEYKLSIKR